MTELNIANLIKNQRRYESELLILKDCTDGIHDAEDTSEMLRYAILKRRLALISHWLHLLSVEESQLLQKHMVDKQSWKTMAEEATLNSKWDIICDARSLQRMQAKALKCLEEFVRSAFGNTLDYLIDNGTEDAQP